MTLITPRFSTIPCPSPGRDSCHIPPEGELSFHALPGSLVTADISLHLKLLLQCTYSVVGRTLDDWRVCAMGCFKRLPIPTHPQTPPRVGFAGPPHPWWRRTNGPGDTPLDPGRIMRVQGRRHRPVGRLTHITRPCRAESKTTITETPPVKSWHQGTGREFVGTEPAHARRPGPPKTGSGRRSRHRRDCTPPTTESSPVARHSLQCGKSSRVHRSASRSITGRFRTAAFTGTARP